MTDSTLAAAGASPALPSSVEALAQTLPGFQSGARWFWWIAGLSAVNVAFDLAHANVNFVLGLAFTLIAHGAFAANLGAALLVDALFIGGFWFIGQQALKGRTWAFAVGVVAYVIDGLIYLKVQDWMPVAFHALALFYIVKAFMSLREAKKVAGLR